TATSGTFSGSGTLTSEQVAGMLAAKTYCEVDDSAFPSGELRGPLSLPSAAPALPPVGVGWLAIALGAMGIALLRTRGRGRGGRKTPRPPPPPPPRGRRSLHRPPRAGSPRPPKTRGEPRARSCPFT